MLQWLKAILWNCSPEFQNDFLELTASIKSSHPLAIDLTKIKDIRNKLMIVIKVKPKNQTIP